MGIQVAGSMYRRYPFLLCATLVLFCPVHSDAQVKDGFVQALIEFANAANGDVTDNGAALTAAIDAMAQGLAAWDAALARMESGWLQKSAPLHRRSPHACEPRSAQPIWSEVDWTMR